MDDRQKKKVLIVDDDESIRDSLKEILKDDYELFVAENGKEALERAGNEANMPDIILMDIFLPEINGNDVCKELKANPKTCYIPVIFITSHAGEFFENNWLGSGGVDFILKPFESDGVKTRVKIQLEMNNKLRIYHKSILDHNMWSRVIQTQLKDILNDQQELISSIESIMKIPFPGKS